MNDIKSKIVFAFQTGLTYLNELLMDKIVSSLEEKNEIMFNKRLFSVIFCMFF